MFMNRLYIIRLLLICSIFSSSFFIVWGNEDSVVHHQSAFKRKKDNPAPVVPFHDTLFHVQAGIGSFSSHDRALSISEKIRHVCKEYNNYLDTLTIVSEGGLLEITYRDIVVMSITETDAIINEKTQAELASEYTEIINVTIAKYIKDKKWSTIIYRVLLILLIIIVQYILLNVVNMLFRKLFHKILSLKGTKIKTIKIKNYVLMDEGKSTGFILLLFKILRYVVLFLMLYLSITTALSVFPATRHLAGILWGYILTPLNDIFHGVINYIPDLITIIVIVIVFRYLIKGLGFFAEEIHKGRLSINGFYPDWAHPTFNIVKTLLYAFMLVVIFPLLPFWESPAFKGVSIFFGVIFSLGSSSVINNVVSGLVLTYMRPFNIGDRIKIGDIVGNVMEKTPLVTRIRTPKNEEVTIPNSNIMTAQTFNYSEAARIYGLILHSTYSFGYDTPWRKVHELLLEAAKRTPDVMVDPKPFILQTALDDFYANYQLNVYIRDADKIPRIYSDMHQNVQDVFNENGIELTSFHYEAARDANKSTIPVCYMPENVKTTPS